MADRPSSNRNPLHKADAQRDRVINFAGDCRRIAASNDIDQLARFDGHPEFRRQMLEQALAAHAVLSRLITPSLGLTEAALAIAREGAIQAGDADDDWSADQREDRA